MVAHDLLTMRCGKDGDIWQESVCDCGVWLPISWGSFWGFLPKVPFPHNFATSRNFDVTKQVRMGLAGQHLCQTCTAIRCGMY